MDTETVLERMTARWKLNLKRMREEAQGTVAELQ